MRAVFALFLIPSSAHRLEPPPGVILHGGGEYPGNFESYSAAMGPSLAPSIKMLYFGDWQGLNSTPPSTPHPWFVAALAELESDGAPDSAFIIPQIGLQLDVAGLASGALDPALSCLRASLRLLARPVFLRVGYEFNGPWNAYPAPQYVAAYRRLSAAIRGDPVLNPSVALVWDGSCDTGVDPTPYWPGDDDQVDWQGVNLFSRGSAPVDPPQSCPWFWFEDSKKAGFPILIGEATPRGLFTNRSGTWAAWFAPLLALLAERKPGLLSYIDMDWEHTDSGRWVGWGDSRVEAPGAEAVLEGWKGAASGWFNRANRSDVLAVLGLPPGFPFAPLG